MIFRSIFFLTLFSACLCGEQAVDHFEYKTIGTLSPRQKTILGSQVAGIVKDVFVDVGSVVTASQPLVALDKTYFAIAVAEAQASLSSAQLECKDAERNFERMKKLFDKPEGQTPSISQKRFEEAENRFLQAEISLKRAQEFLKKMQKNEEDATIKALFDGVVSKRFVHPGDPVTVTPTTKLIEIISIEKPYVEFSIPQKSLHHVHVGTPVFIVIEGMFHEKKEIVIDCIYPDIDEKTRSIKCRATLLDRGGALPGALVEVFVPLQNQE